MSIMTKKSLLLFAVLVSTSIFAQKKILDHTDYELWNTVQNPSISPNGDYVLYELEQGEKDAALKVMDIKGKLIFEHERADKAAFTYNSEFVLFTITAWKDTVRAMKSRKTKKDDMPKDSLGVLNLSTNELTKIAHVKSFQLPEKWSGYVAYYMDEVKEEKKKDTLQADAEKKKKPKKVSKKNGYHLVLRNLKTERQDTILYVTDFIFAKEGKSLAYATTGKFKEEDAALFVMDLETQTSLKLHSAQKARYFNLSLSDSGAHLGFVTDTDTTKIQIRPNKLYVWNKGNETAKKILDPSTAPKGYMVSPYGDIEFSKDESKLFFGLATPPIIKDTTLTEDQIVNVEVWTYDEPRLYTVQELQLKNDSIASYRTAVHLKSNKIVPLATSDFPNTELGDEGNALYALVNTTLPHELESQWTGRRENDYKLISTNSGETLLSLTKVPRIQLSPKAQYAYGYSRTDSTWVNYTLPNGNLKALTNGKQFFSETNDSPDFPSAYGAAGWTKDDAHLILYDRYDIWQFDPNTGAGTKLTSGRESKTVYRFITLDDELLYIPTDQNWLLTTFNEDTKDAGYTQYNPKTGKTKTLLSSPHRYSKPQKALLNDALIYTRESFTEFPNLRVSDLGFKRSLTLSDANPQQEEYNWGNIEQVNWISLDGKELTGMLVKPENFNPNKKYPMLVNFYEKSSNGIHRHRAPKPERSSLNYSFYTSRGYVIFNPDIEYRIGYPGESAYNCVIPGITSLVEKGFVDKDNIGVQGHSWGGYQIAYLVTKTDIFKAAESGAPVPNMISAYGGIRWWTGLSRQFQYEHTQSRIGGTPWEYPARYIENSPIFNIDKINTPLLIMHNDADGHVPWYQGIEFFISLRRLGKPSWFLNYNGEPHWPLKMQNRQDFNIRMAQFFDHYLKGDAKPVWMEKGVPPIQKGINQGYELMPSEGIK
ncbi:MAG: dipeptidyl aminopeptidase/acylaminoacyl peptidase [Maribacter sp.]|jgi:dipeptidyl aminopeptidase/acylaminoacyl peptidase